MSGYLQGEVAFSFQMGELQRRAGDNQQRFNFRGLLQEIPPSTRDLMVRRSQLKNLRPLRSLCLRSIAKNMDRVWCKDFADNWSNQEAAFLLGPFDELRTY